MTDRFASSAGSGSDPEQLDQDRVRASFDAAAAGYDAVAVLQRTVREQLLDRLDLVRLQPALVLDVGAGTGHASAALARRYRGATVIAVDHAPAMLRQARRQRGWRRRFDLLCADAACLPLPDGCAQLVFCSLMLQWCNDLDAVLRELRRVLSPHGLLALATLGPDTLVELRRAWEAADSYTHVNRFLDMHDVGDAAVGAGFVEPVMDVERFTLTYESVEALMRDLKALGARNATRGRPRGLTSRHRLEVLRAAYERERRAGRLPATYEVVYGHAWVPDSRGVPAIGGEARIPVTGIRRRDRR